MADVEEDIAAQYPEMMAGMPPLCCHACTLGPPSPKRTNLLRQAFVPARGRPLCRINYSRPKSEASRAGLVCCFGVWSGIARPTFCAAAGECGRSIAAAGGDLGGSGL